MLPRLLALDPGGTTGWVEYYTINDKEVFNYGEITGAEHHGALWELVDKAAVDSISLDQELYVILEKFEFRKDERYRDKIDYVAAEYIGVVKSYCRYWGAFRPVSLHMASASLGKGFWDDDKLKRAGYYVKSSKHIRDATRHMLRFRTFVQQDHLLLHKIRRSEP
jgi:hypothetical protein